MAQTANSFFFPPKRGFRGRDIFTPFQLRSIPISPFFLDLPRINLRVILDYRLTLSAGPIPLITPWAVFGRILTIRERNARGFIALLFPQIPGKTLCQRWIDRYR